MKTRKKISFIGSGSVVFTRNLARDILTFPAFADCEVALMDIDAANLELSKKAVEKIISEGKYSAVVTATTDRAQALKNADGVLCTIECSDDRTTASDVNVPLKYNISINIGDTRGPSAIFRYLRTLPDLIDIVRDMEKYCPGAVLLNYTNPMAMLCRSIQQISDIKITGLCHSVQGTAGMLAKWIGAPMNEISYLCAGINHQAFYLKYEWNGKDAYPLIRDALKKPEILNEEQVRNDLFLHLGYYVTESSGHNSEYVAWYRKRKDLMEKYCTNGTGWNPGRQRGVWTKAQRHERRLQEFNNFIDNPVDLNRSEEFASYIFNAVFGDRTMFEFNGNVRNFNLIDNLPYGACVEVPVLASKGGLKPMRAGSLPPQIAALCSISSNCEEMAVEGALTGNKDLIYQACYFDPLSSAVLSLEEIRAMVDEMFKEHEDWLPMFNKGVKYTV
ncbi:MAG: alpha-glucosidase/alpha-galactosidase [Oscillospiraceae bacterium]|nr:alpha-glucosidase/alpha-galactosidase [Oscillospiraceae bacterium]